MIQGRPRNPVKRAEWGQAYRAYREAKARAPAREWAVQVRTMWVVNRTLWNVGKERSLLVPVSVAAMSWDGPEPMPGERV